MCVVQLVIWVVVCPPSVVRICFSETLYITTSPTQPYEERWRGNPGPPGDSYLFRGRPLVAHVSIRHVETLAHLAMTALLGSLPRGSRGNLACWLAWAHVGTMWGPRDLAHLTHLGGTWGPRGLAHVAHLGRPARWDPGGLAHVAHVADYGLTRLTPGLTITAS